MLETIKIALSTNKKIYFASDFHLGAPNLEASHERERKIVAWLESVKTEAEAIFLVGDIFDFWHEYNKVVPRGFVRLLGKLAELADSGIKIYIFRGNHDLWQSDYFEKELGAKVIKDSLVVEAVSNQKTIKLFIAHGDGLGPGDLKYKLLKNWLFDNQIIKWAFKTLLHPNLAVALGQAWANYSWQKHAKEALPKFEGENREWLYLYAKELEAKTQHDYYVFGHRHIILDHPISESSKIIILGDWITHFSYAVFNGEYITLTKISNYETTSFP